MRRPLYLSLSVLTLTACTSLAGLSSGGDPAPAPDPSSGEESSSSGGGPYGGSSGNASSSGDGTPGASGSSSGPSVPGKPETVFQTSFEDGCAGWKAPATLQLRSGIGQSGFSCTVCKLTSDNIAISRTLPAAKAGTYTLDVSGRRSGVNPSKWIVTLDASAASLAPSTPNVTGKLSGAWSAVHLSAPIGEADKLVIWIEAPAAGMGECIDVDDLTLARSP